MPAASPVATAADLDELLHCLAEAAENATFEPLIATMVRILHRHGLPVHRLQIPMTKPTGFRHPLLWALILTWRDDRGMADSYSLRHDWETDNRSYMVDVADVLGDPVKAARLNRVFEAIGGRAARHGGEILKFIGDAMLVIFRIRDGDRAAAAQRMVQTVRESSAEVAEVATELGHDFSAGFGGHIGAVAYGNIGTPDRLDFTVMGPAVNLASRLESLTKTIGATGVFSAEVARHVDGLQPCGRHKLKGIDEPIPVFRIHEP